MVLSVATWNVNGYRSSESEVHSLVTRGDVDVVCLQEIKQREMPPPFPGYTWFWNPAAHRPHLWGTAILARTSLKPRLVEFNFTELLADEGRTIAIRLETLGISVVCVYSPNSGVERSKPLARLGVRLEFDLALRKSLDARVPGPYVVAGDFNVAIRECDVHNPKTLRRKAGFTDDERRSFDTVVTPGLADAWATYTGADTEGFTFWGRHGTLKADNKGWRLDYVLFTPSPLLQIKSAVIHKDEFNSSDHVPLVACFGGGVLMPAASD